MFDTQERVRRRYGELMSRIEAEYEYVQPIPESVMNLYRLASLIHHRRFQTYFDLYGWITLDENQVDEAKRTLLRHGISQFEQDTIKNLNQRCLEMERNSKASSYGKPLALLPASTEQERKPLCAISPI